MAFLLVHWFNRTFGLFPLRAWAAPLGLTLLLHCPLLAQEPLLPVLHFQTLEGFRSDWVTSRVVRDSAGFIWIGTQNGLRRYDGYDFKEYRNLPNDPYSLSSSRIHCMLVDTKQRLWVGTMEKGLSLYDRDHDRFINFYPHPDDSSAGRRTVYGMTEDHAGNIWLATSNGVVRVGMPADGGSKSLDEVARSLTFKRIPLGTPIGEANDIIERSDGKMIVASDSGLIILDPSTFVLSRPHLTDPTGARLDSTYVWCLDRSSDGILWLGTATQGVFRLDWGKSVVTNYRHRDDDSLSIRTNDIWALEEDGYGRLWIGTQKGVDLFSPQTGRRIPYLTYGPTPDGCMLIRLSSDCTGTLWVSTWSNVYRLSPGSRLLPHFSPPKRDGWLRSFGGIERAPDGTLWCFSEGKVMQMDVAGLRFVKTIDVFKGKIPHRSFPDRTSALVDRRGNFWYAAWDLGLYKVELGTGSVSNYQYNTRFGLMTTLRSIAPGNGDSLWLGAQSEGVMIFDPSTETFLPVRHKAVGNLIRDHEGKIWVATEGDGMDIYDPIMGRIDSLVHVPSDAHSLSHNLAWSVYEDPARRIWVGAGNVVNLWDPRTKSFTRYFNPGFAEAPDAYLDGSDQRGRVWIHNQKGLSILDPVTGAFTNIEASDGLCYPVTDMMDLGNGKILVTGHSGMNIVSPDSIDIHRPPPPLVITKMTINDDPVVPQQLLHGSGALQLSYAQNVLEFEFAAIDIEAPKRVQYQYRLEGIENDWVKPIDRRFVRYTALPPGDYIFRVRAAPSWGEWPEQEITLAISISPPWWQTLWAYAAYATFLLGILYAGYRARLRQVQLQQDLKMEHFQREHLAELDRLKSRFFANISHEFRTPLTLILGPIEELRNDVQSERGKHTLDMVRRNAFRLLRLINQLLDLSKVEAGAMKVKASRMNIVLLVKGIAYSFESSAGLRNITLDVAVDQEEIEVYCDKDIVEKILTNLLSNAFKFTPDGGSVVVTLTASPSPGMGEGDRGGEDSSRTDNGFVEISVSDTGIGIPSDQLGKVFDRFYQVDASQTREYEGSGLGLALVKELVETHHGSIEVQSEVGHGTTFTFRLPLGRAHLRDDEIVEKSGSAEPDVHGTQDTDSGKSVGGTSETPEREESRDGKRIVLVVEDNADVRSYIKDHLAMSYSVAEATNGAEGIERALEIIPDLIISDVMMPEKDGFEVCRILKQDEKTSHIPIILLTAKAGSGDRIEGLHAEADDYIIKPFEPKELVARVANLIAQRRKLRERFQTSVPLRPGEIAVTSMDDEFLKKVMMAVERHIGEEDFRVEELSAEVAMSRVQLHRKLTALTNLPPGEFLRYIRLHRAMDLLQKNAGTVSQIAYSVGFSDPSYFTKCFHQQFGVVPTDVRKTPANPPDLPPA
jgi:signal transduction histidine kinase/DNA-binding response OmpR family regulator